MPESSFSAARANQHPAALQHVLNEMPPAVAASFSKQQLHHLQQALAHSSARQRRHRLDWRPSLRIGKRHFYLVVLAGRSLRSTPRAYRQAGRLALALLTCALAIGLGLVGWLGVYWLKSALGIDMVAG